jgi:hypothetical protein
MFGHHDDDESEQQDENTVAPGNQPVDAPAVQPATAPPVDDTPASSFNEPTQSAPPVTEANPTTPPADSWQHPGKPLNNDQIKDIISPAGGFPKRPTYQYPQGLSPAQDDSADSPAAPANPELIDIREHALEELEPLLEKLNLPPEEKFRAIMMILQAKDDQSLVKAAYEAAHSIEDEETKARALYDIVNEVNYFTNPPENAEA